MSAAIYLLGYGVLTGIRWVGVLPLTRGEYLDLDQDRRSREGRVQEGLSETVVDWTGLHSACFTFGRDRLSRLEYICVM